MHIKKERNSKLIRDAKKKFKREHGHLYCEMCGIDFEKVYGELGKDFIEAHHNKQMVASMDEDSSSKIEDLIMLCPNCHNMVHRVKISNANITELKKLIKKSPVYE